MGGTVSPTSLHPDMQMQFLSSPALQESNTNKKTVGDLPRSPSSPQSIVLVLFGVRNLGRPHSLGTTSQRDGCSLTAARIAGSGQGMLVAAI